MNGKINTKEKINEKEIFYGMNLKTILTGVLIFSLILGLCGGVNAYSGGGGTCGCGDGNTTLGGNATDACVDCTAALNDDVSCANEVKLNSNVFNHTGTCINNPANFSNKIFDCKGHTIDGDDTGTDNGISTSSLDNNTIKNCIITGFSKGISIQYGDFWTLVNNSVNNNTADGIRLTGSKYCVLINNTANNNKYGFSTTSSSTNNTLISNTFCSNTQDIDNAGSNNTGSSNTCSKSGGWNDAGIIGCTFSCSGVNIALTKTANVSTAKYNDFIQWNVTVTNTGNVPVNVTFNDSECVLNNITDLQPENSQTRTCTSKMYYNNITNFVTAMATSPYGTANKTANYTVITVNSTTDITLIIVSSTKTVSVNETFNISVNVSGTNILGAGFDLMFNNTLLAALNVSEGSFIRQCGNTSYNTFPPEINNSCGEISFQDMCLGQAISGTGDVAVITFKSLAGGISNLLLYDAEIFDSNGDLISGVIVENGTVRSNLPPVANISSPADGYGTMTYTEVMFNGTGSYDPDGSVVNWTWNFGDGINAAGSVVTHNYTDDGVYTVILTVTDNDGELNSTKIIVNITNQPPQAEAGSNKTAYDNQALHFNGSGSYDIDGNITSYYWDFGDGSNGTGITPTHSYVSIGNYTVNLTVTDDGELTDSDTLTVTVYLAGDVSRDGCVNIYDLAKLAAAWGTSTADAKFNTHADFNGDGTVNVLDLAQLAANWKTCA